MIKLFVALSAVALLGLTAGCAEQKIPTAQSAGAGGCEQVGTTGCKPDPSFGHQTQVGCEQVGTTGCKPDPSFGRKRPETPVMPPVTQ